MLRNNIISPSAINENLLRASTDAVATDNTNEIGERLVDRYLKEFLYKQHLSQIYKWRTLKPR